jgi:hypothetical protein
VAALVPLIFRNPFVTSPTVVRAVGVSEQGARDLLRKAENYGWIRNVGNIGKGGKKLWMAEEIYRVIDEPLSYGASEP